MFNSRKPSADELPTAGQLLRSTAVAAVVAVLILVTAVLPGEYGVDPTGIGRVLGLTRMGETKMRLAHEAAREEAATTPAGNTHSARATAPTAATVVAPVATGPASKTDEVTVMLKPGQAAEIKVEMRKGAQIRYRWTASGGRVNFDTHGDPYDAPRNFYHGYGKGRAAQGDEGTLEAAFDGFHGWFWRNRANESVAVTLRVEGDYAALKRVL